MDFTESERHRIDNIACKIANDEDITASDALLYAKWESSRAVRDASYNETLEAMRRESVERAENAKKEHESAMRDMEELHRKAVERFDTLR